MKKIIVTIAAALMALGAAANNAGGPGSYCVESRDGKTIVTYNGSELTKKVKLEDGTKLKPNGTVVLASGKRVKLVQGECIDENNLSQLSNRKSPSEERMDKNKQHRKEKREARKARRDSYDVM
jgi:hypothetical protein